MSGYFITRTPWRTRLIIWPGMPFRTLPFPYLFHRFDLVFDLSGDYGKGVTSWCGGFFLRSSAEDALRRITE